MQTFPSNGLVKKKRQMPINKLINLPLNKLTGSQTYSMQVLYRNYTDENTDEQPHTETAKYRDPNSKAHTHHLQREIKILIDG